MNHLIEQDAADYGRWSSGWRLGLLVARSVEKGKGGARTVPKGTVAKASAREFAEKAGTSVQRVLRHLEAWQAAAADGHVPDAATLEPGQEVELGDELPDWKTYYPPITGGHDGPPTVASLKKALTEAKPEHLAAAVEQLDEGTRAKAAVSIREGAEMGGERERKERRAVREEIQEDPAAAHVRLIRLELARAEDDLDHAAATARDTNFSAEQKELLLQRIETVTARKLDLVRMAIQGTETIDWDAELERLNQLAEEA